MQTFGKCLRELRLARRRPLSELADVLEMSGVDYSRVERDIDPPPSDLVPFVNALGLCDTDLAKLRAAATFSKSTWEPKVPSDAEVLAKMPALPTGLTNAQLNTLVDAVRDAHTSRI